jgi:hypothetical protein
MGDGHGRAPWKLTVEEGKGRGMEVRAGCGGGGARRGCHVREGHHGVAAWEGSSPWAAAFTP